MPVGPDTRSAAPDRPADPDEIRDALARVLASREFAASDRRRRFLEFVVEETLAGRAKSLKGFTIAQQIFGRDESFDPKSDPVVRLEARRLRRDLDSYYVGPGAGERLRIAIPKGGYVPEFEQRAAALPPDPAEPPDDIPAAPASAAVPLRRGWYGLAAGLALAGAVAAGTLVWLDRADPAPQPGKGPPGVVILPFAAADDSETSRILSTGLSSQTMQDLIQFQDLRLYLPRGDTDLAAKIETLRAGTGAVFLVRGEVYSTPDRAQVDVHLLEGQTDEVIWSNRYDVALDPAELGGLRHDISGRIATTLGQPYGPLRDQMRRRAGAEGAATIESYLCLLEAYDYRRNFSAAKHAPVRACLEAAVTRDPRHAAAWAMLGWLHLDAGRFDFVAPDQVAVEYAAAFAAADRALELEPENVQALKAKASILHYAGRFTEAEQVARHALALNPYDPDTLAQVGWRLAVRGNFDGGIPLLEQAIDRSIDPPGWYRHLLAMHLFFEGDYARMHETAVLSATGGSGFSQYLIAVAAGALGDAEGARAAIARVAEAPALARDPAAFMRRHGATEEIIAGMLAGYATAERLAAR